VTPCGRTAWPLELPAQIIPINGEGGRPDPPAQIIFTMAKVGVARASGRSHFLRRRILYAALGVDWALRCWPSSSNSALRAKQSPHQPYNIWSTRWYAIVSLQEMKLWHCLHSRTWNSDDPTLGITVFVLLLL